MQRKVLLDLVIVIGLMTQVGRGAPHLAKQYPLRAAVERCDVAELQSLLARGDFAPESRDARHALQIAAEKGPKEAVEALLARGVSADAADGSGTTVLMCAARGGQVEAVRLLLANGANILAKDAVGWTALFYAAHGQQVATVKALLDVGANVRTRDRNGQTAIAVARLRTLMDVNVPSWVPLIGDMSIGGTWRSRGSSPVIEALKAAGAEEE